MTKTPYELISEGYLEHEYLEPVKPHLHIRIEVRRDVTHASGLASVAEGFQSLDGLLRTELDIKGQASLKGSLLDARAKLQRFKVNSDPVAEFIANYPWLSVLVLAVVVVRDYQRFKQSGAEMLADAKSVVNAIRGLTRDQKDRVGVGVQLLLEQLLSLSEESLRAWADKLNRTHRLLVGVDGERPLIAVDETDN